MGGATASLENQTMTMASVTPQVVVKKIKRKMMNILLIPDTQVKPGVPLDHLHALSKFIVHRRPDVIVHIGDHWDMASLSSYDFGKKAMEGRRVHEDIEAGKGALMGSAASGNWIGALSIVTGKQIGRAHV